MSDNTFGSGIAKAFEPAISDDKTPGDPPKTKPEEASGEDQALNALIMDLESVDGYQMEDEKEVDATQEGPIPEEYLETDRNMGLTNQEVLARRKKFGPNLMKEEKQNKVLKFIMFFYGPIQFVMEVSFLCHPKFLSPVPSIG